MQTKPKYLFSFLFLTALFALFISLFNPALSHAAYPSDGSTNLVQITAKVFVPQGQEKYLVLIYQNEPGWHTYWKNPGDAGTPFEHKFSFGSTAVPPSHIDEMEWPAPERFSQPGDLVAYGYEGRYAFFFRIDPSFFSQNQGKDLTITSTHLVCKEICIPSKKTLTAKIVGSDLQLADATTEHNAPYSEIAQFFANIPQPFTATSAQQKLPDGLKISLYKGAEENKLLLRYSWENASSSVDTTRNFLTPFPHQLFTFKHEVLLQDASNHLYGEMPVEWDGAYVSPSPIALPANGVFSSAPQLKFLLANPHTQQVEVINVTIDHFELTPPAPLESTATALRPIAAAASPINPATQEDMKKKITSDSSLATSTEPSSISLPLYLLFAFLGGFILNFMPCVLPVISLKLFGLIKQNTLPHPHILRHNLFYSLGIFATFSIFAMVVVGLQQSGEQVGWGFHLQSPTFIAIMIIILFIFALNLFGLFEFATPGGKWLGNISIQNGAAGDFFNGILATILSTPCSAPFLGTALTFAFTSAPHTIFLIFLCIGLGLSFPFLLTGFFPRLISFLPRPGHWMEHLKKFLGLTLLFTLIWLLTVFVILAPSPLFLSILLFTLCLIFFALYFKKTFFTYSTSLKTTPVLYGLHKFFLLLPFCSFLFLLHEISLYKEMPTMSQAQAASPHSSWEPWSQEKLVSLAQEKAWVFMDFTADWCFTCKVNEKLVLATNDFQQLAQKYHLRLLLADWTKKDDRITNFLKQHGAVGVPAYFIQRPNGTIISLGETISISEIEENLSDEMKSN